MNELNNNNTLLVNDSWRYLHLNYINQCDLLEKYGNSYKSIYDLPKIKKIYLYLNSWEAQKSCEEVKANTIMHADFQIGLMSLLQLITNNPVKIEKRTKEYSVLITSRKKSKMQKSLVFKSATFKSTLNNNKDILNFLEYLYLEVSNNIYYDIFRNKKVTITKQKKIVTDIISLKIPLEVFPDLVEHNKLNLNEIFSLSDINVHIDIMLKHKEKKTPYYYVYPFWYSRGMRVKNRRILNKNKIKSRDF